MARRRRSGHIMPSRCRPYDRLRKRPPSADAPCRSNRTNLPDARNHGRPDAPSPRTRHARTRSSWPSSPWPAPRGVSTGVPGLRDAIPGSPGSPETPSEPHRPPGRPLWAIPKRRGSRRHGDSGARGSRQAEHRRPPATEHGTRPPAVPGLFSTAPDAPARRLRGCGGHPGTILTRCGLPGRATCAFSARSLRGDREPRPCRGTRDNPGGGMRAGNDQKGGVGIVGRVQAGCGVLDERLSADGSPPRRGGPISDFTRSV